MKNLCRCLGIIAFVIVYGVLYAACYIDGNYDGNSRERAISLTEDLWKDGVISSSYSEQWFRFTASAGNQYVHVFFGTLTDLYVQLYDSNDNAVGDGVELHDSGGRKNSDHVIFTVTNGKTYYIRVTGCSNSDTGTYRIGYNTMLLAPGTLAGAATLADEVWVDGVITPSKGEQWFKFTAVANTHYLHVFFGTLTDLYVQLYDSGGAAFGNRTELHGNSGNRDTDYKSLIVTSGKIYYVNVTGYESSDTGTYRIAVNTSNIAPEITDL